MAFFGIQKLTVTTAASGQCEDAVFKVEVIDQAGFAEPLGDLLRLFVLGFKRVDQIEANEVNHLHFHGHGAAVGGTTVAHAGFVSCPTFDAIDVDDADG
jgi:hypothetical protein